ncbi:serine hydrolase [Pseudomonas fluorescens]|uniref:serine hydrolase n=1 Tax=Pseudomonas fluorescens TaxID=294 RepID=UPI001BE82604|nr:serine hydrolase [Pseudomonas fluorescens]MBT2375239.1 D-alanyl-D-alanine carboxypeptidase [Pseudomonas fluorescens]
MGILTRSLAISWSRLWRLFKWGCLKYCYAVTGRPRFTAPHLDNQPTLGPFEKPDPKTLSIVTGDTPFPTNEALHGTVATEELCAQIPSGLWIEVEGQGYCVRYYAYGLASQKNAQILVYFGGDALLTTSKGVRHISTSYQSQTPAKIEAATAEWSCEANAPAIFLARPGLYGSSGNHLMRRQPLEIALMDQALDALKQRYTIGSFILAGQSGGGQIVAALLSRREDITAAVLASSLVSVRQVAAYWEYQRDIPARFLQDSTRFYDPLDDIERIPKAPPPTLYVISDPEDQVVPFNTQLRYVRHLRKAKLNPQHIFAHAKAPAHHVLTEHARLAAALIAKGATPQTVRARLNKLDREQACNENAVPARRPFERYSPPDIDAPSAISLKVAQGTEDEHELLFDKSSTKQLPLASLTKLMTAVVMFDLMPRFGKSLTDYLDIDETDVVGESGINVKPGEKITFRDAILNLMLPSSNITANAIGRTFGRWLIDDEGSPEGGASERFIAQMNAKAAQIGMHNTQFHNPSGQSVRGQLTTAADMATLMLTAMQYPHITESWGKPSHVMQVLGPTPRQQKISSTIKVIDDYDVLGGKTGTLQPGCYNVAVLSEAPDGGRIVTVILRAPDQMALYTDLRCILDTVKRGRNWSTVSQPAVRAGPFMVVEKSIKNEH